MDIDVNACTGLAFDNYDHFVETLTEKDTHHDTIGIAYQTLKLDNIDSNPSGNQETIEINLLTTDF